MTAGTISYTASRAFGSAAMLTRTAQLTFDDAGKLISGNVSRNAEIVFPVPIPPGVGGITPSLGSRRLDVSDPAVQSLAQRMARAAEAGGGITSVKRLDPRSRVLIVDTATGMRVERLPGGAARFDDWWFRRDLSGEPAATAASIEFAALGQALLRA